MQEIKIEREEYWFGGMAADGVHQPYGKDSRVILDFTENRTPNQSMPLMLSTKGRWFYGEKPFRAEFAEGFLILPDEVPLHFSGGSLKEAYREARNRYFPFDGRVPPAAFFRHPVYNTWIEFTFNQTQENILSYAAGILGHDFPAGILMIDDGWSPYYGRWSFSGERFENPNEMISRLHAMGFQVMLWICPFISADTAEFRELQEKQLLVSDAQGETWLAHWWNGWSAVLDMRKKGARGWLKSQLDSLQRLGIDGFKFDGGDSIYYPAGTGDSQCRAWSEFGKQYDFNEFRASAGAGGWPLIQRQCDKDHSWGSRGISALIPDAVVQSLTGYPYSCPDMIGGGEYRSFQNLEVFDEELMVRWAQTACMMPVMQFSAAPWDLLSVENLEKVRQAVKIREEFGDYLWELARKTAQTGEPMLSPLCYDFKDGECLRIQDQFMIGDILVAPILERNQKKRRVYLPAGSWLDRQGHLIPSRGEYRILDADAEPVLLFCST